MKKIAVQIGLFLAVAGVAYLATLGCGGLVRGAWRSAPWSQRLGLTGEEKDRVAALEKEFLAQNRTACGTLCAKRAQMITLLKQEKPDRAVLAALVEEIGFEQLGMEKTAMDHVLAVASQLDPAARERYLALVREELRTACKGTACGMGPACAAKR